MKSRKLRRLFLKQVMDLSREIVLSAEVKPCCLSSLIISPKAALKGACFYQWIGDLLVTQVSRMIELPWSTGRLWGRNFPNPRAILSNNAIAA